MESNSYFQHLYPLGIGFTPLDDDFTVKKKNAKEEKKEEEEGKDTEEKKKEEEKTKNYILNAHFELHTVGKGKQWDMNVESRLVSKSGYIICNKAKQWTGDELAHILSDRRVLFSSAYQIYTSEGIGQRAQKKNSKLHEKKDQTSPTGRVEAHYNTWRKRIKRWSKTRPRSKKKGDEIENSNRELLNLIEDASMIMEAYIPFRKQMEEGGKEKIEDINKQEIMDACELNPEETPNPQKDIQSGIDNKEENEKACAWMISFLWEISHRPLEQRDVDYFFKKDLLKWTYALAAENSRNLILRRRLFERTFRRWEVEEAAEDKACFDEIEPSFLR